MPALWAAGASVVSGFLGSSSSKKAAKQAAEAQDRATAEQRRQFEVTQEQMKPYREAGLRGLTSYEDLLGRQGEFEDNIQSDVPGAFSFNADDFNEYKDPGYEFRLSEGERVINRNASRVGGMGGGGRYRGLMQLGQDMGSQEFGAARGRAYQDYTSGVASEQETYARSLDQYGRQYATPMNQHAALFGAGQTATTELGQLRQGMADKVSQGIARAGEYTAAGTMGTARAWQSAIGDIGQAAGEFDWSKLKGTG